MALEARETTRTILARGGLAAMLAAGANALVAVLADRILDIPAAFEPLTPLRAAFLTVLGALGAAATYLVVLRVAEKPAQTFVNVAGVALLLSFVPDLWLLVNPDLFEGTTKTGVAVLMVMHVIAAAIIVPVLVRGRIGEEPETDPS